MDRLRQECTAFGASLATLDQLKTLAANDTSLSVGLVMDADGKIVKIQGGSAFLDPDYDRVNWCDANRAWYCAPTPTPAPTPSPEQIAAELAAAEKRRSEIIESKSMRSDVEAFQTEMKRVASNLDQEAKMSANTMAEDLAKINTVTDSSGANAEDARIQVNSVTDAVDYFTRKVHSPLITAKEFENTIERLGRGMDAMRKGIVRERNNMPKVIKVGSETTLKNMDAKFNRFFANADMYTMKRLGDNRVKIDALERQRQNLNDKFVAKFGQKIDVGQLLSKKLDDKLDDAVDSVAKQKKVMKKAEQLLVKLIKKGRSKIMKTYHRQPKDRVTQWKKFEKEVEKGTANVDKVVDKALELQVKQLGEQTERVKDWVDDNKKKARDYGVAVVQASKELLGEDIKKTKRSNDKTLQIGTWMLNMLSDVRSMQELIETLRSEFGQKTASARIDAMTRIAGVTDDLARTVKRRNPAAMQGVDEQVGMIKAAIDHVVKSVRETVDEGKNNIDIDIRNAMDRIVTPLADTVSLARHTKLSSQGIEATAIELGALQHAAHTTAERINREMQDVTTLAGNQINQATGSMRQALTIGGDTYQRESDAEYAHLRQKMNYRITTLDEPVKQKLTSTLRDLQALYDYASQNQEISIGDMKLNLGEIKDMLRRNPGLDDELIWKTVPEYLKAMVRYKTHMLMALEQLITSLKKDTSIVERTAELRQISSKADLLAEAAAMKRSVAKAVSKRTRNVLGSLVKIIDVTKEQALASTAQNRDMIDTQQYLRNILQGLADHYLEEQEILAAQWAKTQETVSEIVGPRMDRLFSEAQGAISSVDVNCKESMAQIREKDKARLVRYQNHLQQAMDTHKLAILHRMKEIDAELNAIPWDGLFDRVAHQRTEIAAAQLLAQNKTEEGRMFMDDLEKRTHAITLIGQHAEREARTRYEKAKSALDHVQEILREEEDLRIRSVERRFGAKQEMTAGSLLEKIKALSGFVQKVNKKRKDEVRYVQMSLGGEKDEVEHVQRWYKEVSEQVDALVSGFERDTKHKIDINAGDIAEDETNRQDDVEQQTSANNVVTNKMDSIIDAINGETTHLSIDRDDKADKLAEEMQTATKSVRIASEASWIGLNTQVDNAKNVLNGAQADLKLQDKSLYEVAKELDDSQKAYEKAADSTVLDFKTQVKTMQDELKRDGKYLESYESYTLSAVLSLIYDQGKTLWLTAKEADSMYGQMMDKELSIMDEALRAQSGEGYQSLRKVQLADMQIQSGLQEDQQMVEKIRQHGESQISWMEGVIHFLDEEYNKSSTSEGGANERNHVRGEKAAQQLSGLVDGAISEVDGTVNSMPYGNLEVTANESTQALEVAQQDLSSSANRAINELLRQNDGLDEEGEAGLAELKKGQKDAEAQATSGSEVARAVTQDVNKMREEGMLMVKQEREEQAGRATELLDRASGMTVEEPPAAGTLLQTATTPQMAALLAQTARLSKLHAGLGSQQALLGHEVERVAELGRRLLRPAALRRAAESGRQHRPAA